MPGHASAAPLRSCLLTAVNPSRREGSSPTGVVGRRVARMLVSAGVRVTVVAESRQQSGWCPGVVVVAGSPDQPGRWLDALSGVDAIFLAGAGPRTAPEILDRAQADGVRRVVLLSSHGPEFEAAYPPETWHWLAVENAVRAAALDWTIIRPSAVMGSILEGTYPATGHGWRAMVRTTGRIEEALLDVGYYPFIHKDDLAGVAAVALQSGQYSGQVLEAVGLPISTRSRVEDLGRSLGRTLTTRSLSAQDGRLRWQADGWPQGAIDVTLYGLAEYAAHLAELVDWTRQQAPSVAAVLGRPPRDFATWAREHRGWFSY